MSLDDAAQEARRLLTQNTVQESLDYLATITKTIDESSSNLRRIIGGSYLDVMHACEEVVGMRTTCADLWRIQSALSSTPHNKSDAEKSSPPRSWSPVTAIRAKALPSSLSGTVKEELGLLPLLDSLSAASGSNSVSTTAATQPNGLLVHEDHDKRSSSAAETSISHLGHLQEQLCAVEGYFAADSVVEAARTLRDIRRQLEQHQHSDSSKDERLERHLLLNVTAYERRLLQRVETNLHRDAREAALYAIDGTAKMAATSYSRGREGFAESWKSSLAAARQRWRSLSLALQYLQPSMELLSELLSVSEGSTEVELSQDVNPALIAVQDVLRFSNMSSLRGVIRHAEGSTDSVRSSPSHLTVMVLLMCDLLRQHAKSVGQNLHRGDEEQQFVAVGVESNDPAATSLAWAVEALILMVQLSSYLAALVSPEGTEATVQEALEPWSIDQRAMDALGSKQVLRKLIEARQTVSTMPTPADVSDSVAAKARGVSASSAVGDGKTLTTARRSTKAYRDYLLRAVGTHRAVRGTMFEAEADKGHHPEPFVVPDHSKGVAEVVAVLPLVATVAESILRPYLRAVFTPFCRDPRTIRTLRELWSMHLSPALAHSVGGLAKVSTTSSAFLHSVKDGVEEVVSEALTQELQRTLRSAERLQKAFVEELGIDPSPMDGREKTASQHTLLPNSLSLHQMVRLALGKHTAWSTSMPGTSIGRESLGLPQHAQTTRGVWKQRIGEALRVERGPSRGVGAESTAVGQHTSSDRERSVIHAIYPAVQTSNTESPQCSSDSPSVSSWIEALVQLVKLVDIMRGVFGGSERLRATSAQPSQDDGWRQAILQWARESLNCFTEVEQRLRALAAGDSQDLKNPVHVACRLYELAALVDVYRVSLRSLLEVLLRDASNYPSAGNPLPPVTPSALERHLEAFQSQAKDLYERCHRPWIMAVTSEWMNFVEGLYTRQFGLPPPSTAEPRFPTPSAGGISDRGGDGGSFPTRLSPDLLGGISQLQGIVLALLDCRPGIHSISASSSRISGVIDRNGTLASNGGPSQPASCVGQTAPYISQSVRADLYLSILEAIPETIERRVLATLSTAKSVSTAAAEGCMQLFLDVYAQKLLFARCVPEGSSCQPATAASIVRRADAAEQRLQQLLLNISRSIDPVRWHHAQGPIRQAGEVLVVRAALFLGIPATHSVGAKALALDGADSSAPVLHKKADAPRFALLPIASTAASSSALTAGAGAGGVGLFRAASPEALASGMLGTRTRPAMEDVVGHAAPTPSAGNAPHVGMSLWNSTQRGWSSLWGAGEKGDAIR